jgi:hypothetical protein
MTEDLRYPIGPEPAAAPLGGPARVAALEDIVALPRLLRQAVANLTRAQIDTPYRPGGWTVRQVVHHVADSHVHALIRMKMALVEDRPTISPYDERVWAELPDSRLPVDVSLTLLDGVHERWAALLRSLDETAFARVFIHPERPEPVSLARHLQIYSWHSRHHTAHITSLRRREGW